MQSLTVVIQFADEVQIDRRRVAGAITEAMIALVGHAGVYSVGDVPAMIDPPSEHDVEHLGDVLRAGDWWSARLLQLIAKSDPAHLEALRAAAPAHVAAYEAWCAQPETPLQGPTA